MISSKPNLTTKFNKVSLRSNHFTLKFQESLQIKRYTISVQGEPQGGSLDLIASVVQKIKSQIQKTFSDSHHVSGKVLYCWGKPSPAQEELPEVTLRCENLSVDFVKVKGDLTLADVQKESISNKAELLQAINVWFAALASKLGLKELGGSSGQFFNLDKIEGEIQDQLNVHSGFKISPEVYQGNQLKLLVDCQTRVVSKWTLLEQYEYDLDQGMEEREFVDQFIGDTFLHTPTNRKITIDGFAMTLRPSQPYPHAQFKTVAEFYTKCLNQKNIDPN